VVVSATAFRKMTLIARGKGHKSAFTGDELAPPSKQAPPK
jgi:hypothetical protein